MFIKFEENGITCGITTNILDLYFCGRNLKSRSSFSLANREAEVNGALFMKSGGRS